MPLVTTKGMLLDAQKRNYAIGAFNANNLEMAQGIVKAAEEENAPVIVQVSQGGARYAGINEMAAVVKILARNTKIPVALHLDHGVNYTYNVLALNAGFTSLMFDGSRLDFEKNVTITRKIVIIAHIAGIPVEAELGEVPKDPNEVDLNDLEQYMTEPDEAKEFIEKTEVDSLAVAVGSMHKMKNQSTELDIERVKRIREEVDVPLVLHGASGVTDESAQQAIKAGICKVNVHTHIAKHFTNEVRAVLDDNPDMVDLRKYLDEGREALKKEVKKKIHLFGANGRADSIEDVDVVPYEDIEQEIVE